MKTSILAVLASCALYADAPRFSETLYPDWGQFFEMSEKVFFEKTEFQDLAIFENPKFGRVLALDGIIQLTEGDEFVYHEMLAHVPLYSHDNPKSVLIIGGGDGGILREVLKHQSVERAVLCEIDPNVIEMAKKYFPKISNGAFDNSRTEVIIQDASKFVKETADKFDVIICDSSDPIGPSAVLFSSEFYGDCKARLNEGGIFVNMSGVPFLQPNEQELTFKNCSPHFENVGFFLAPVPTYVAGFLAMGWASDKDYQVSEDVLRERIGSEVYSYYNPAIHKASFALPNFMIRQLLGE